MQIPMVNVEIIGPKKLLFATLATLHKLGILHIQDFSKDTAPDTLLTHEMKMDTAQEKDEQTFETLLARINGTISDLGIAGLRFLDEEKSRLYPELRTGSAEHLLERAKEITDEIEGPTVKLAEQKSELEAEYWRLKKCEPILEKIQPLAEEITTPAGFEFIALSLDRAAKEDLGHLEKDLNQLTEGQCELFSMDVDDDTTAAIFIFNSTFSPAVHRFLFKADVNVLQLSPELAGKPAKHIYDSLKDRLKDLTKQKKQLAKELKKISNRWSMNLIVLREILHSRLAELEIVPRLGSTSYAFVISGWLPQKSVHNVRELLRKEVGEEVTLTTLKPTSNKWETAPVALKNPSWAKPFQFFYQLIKPPKYGTVDPTSFIAIFFPILFGVVVGDVGYGLVILAVALLVKRKLKGMVLAQVFASVALIASISAIFFGAVLFVELFGNLGEELIARFFGLHPPYLNILGLDWPIVRGEPETSFPILMTMAIAIGVIHLSMGFAFGLINGLRTHHYRHVYEKGGFLLLMIVLVLAVFTNWVKVLPQGTNYLALALGGVAVIAIAVGGGVQAITEIFGTFANIISYSRLMALSLAGVIMANAINVLASRMGALGGVAIVGGVILAVFLHAINIIICVLSPSIHSLRLHLVECFSKFYEPATVDYEPFQLGGEKR